MRNVVSPSRKSLPFYTLLFCFSGFLISCGVNQESGNGASRESERNSFLGSRSFELTDGGPHVMLEKVCGTKHVKGCNGIVIGEKAILTAGHCAQPEPGYTAAQCKHYVYSKLRSSPDLKDEATVFLQPRVGEAYDEKDSTNNSWDWELAVGTKPNKRRDGLAVLHVANAAFTNRASLSDTQVRKKTSIYDLESDHALSNYQWVRMRAIDSSYLFPDDFVTRDPFKDLTGDGVENVKCEVSNPKWWRFGRRVFAENYFPIGYHDNSWRERIATFTGFSEIKSNLPVNTTNNGCRHLAKIPYSPLLGGEGGFLGGTFSGHSGTPAFDAQTNHLMGIHIGSAARPTFVRSQETLKKMKHVTLDVLSGRPFATGCAEATEPGLDKAFDPTGKFADIKSWAFFVNLCADSNREVLRALGASMKAQGKEPRVLVGGSSSSMLSELPNCHPNGAFDQKVVVIKKGPSFVVTNVSGSSSQENADFNSARVVTKQSGNRLDLRLSGSGIQRWRWFVNGDHYPLEAPADSGFFLVDQPLTLRIEAVPQTSDGKQGVGIDPGSLRGGEICSTDGTGISTAEGLFSARIPAGTNGNYEFNLFFSPGEVISSQSPSPTLAPTPTPTPAPECRPYAVSSSSITIPSTVPGLRWLSRDPVTGAKHEFKHCRNFQRCRAFASEGSTISTDYAFDSIRPFGIDGLELGFEITGVPRFAGDTLPAAWQIYGLSPSKLSDGTFTAMLQVKNSSGTVLSSVPVTSVAGSTNLRVPASGALSLVFSLVDASRNLSVMSRSIAVSVPRLETTAVRAQPAERTLSGCKVGWSSTGSNVCTAYDGLGNSRVGGPSSDYGVVFSAYPILSSARRYTLTVRCQDAAGGVSSKTKEVTGPYRVVPSVGAAYTVPMNCNP